MSPNTIAAINAGHCEVNRLAAFRIASGSIAIVNVAIARNGGRYEFTCPPSRATASPAETAQTTIVQSSQTIALPLHNGLTSRKNHRASIAIKSVSSEIRFSDLNGQSARL